jgi:hypothetical protein
LKNQRANRPIRAAGSLNLTQSQATLTEQTKEKSEREKVAKQSVHSETEYYIIFF